MENNGSPRVKNLHPLHHLLEHIQNKKAIEICYKNLNLRLRGHIVGYDDNMNIVLDDAEEIDMKTKNRKKLGRITLKGNKMANKDKAPLKANVHRIDLLRFLQNRSRVQIYVNQHEELQIEGYIVGYDEYLNIILDDTEIINTKEETRKKLGRLVMQGVHIKSIMEVNPDGSYCKPVVHSKL